MNAINRNASRTGRFAVAATLALILAAAASARLRAAEKEAASKSVEPEPGEYANSVTLGIGNFFVNEDRAAFHRRVQMPAGTFGGIEELHFEQMIGEKGLFQIDGHGLFNHRDYDIQIDVSHPDIGYLRGGYRHFRSWYDGSGGYSVRSNAWIEIYDDELFVDRGKAWVEGRLNLPDWPVFTVSYAYDFREGRKDSTSWGDFSLSLNNANVRNIVPTFLGIDEQRHTVAADVKHTMGDTSFGVGMRYERDDIDNSRNIRRRPGESTRVRSVTQNDSTDADIWNGHFFVETRLAPEVRVTVGGSYTRLDTDIAGSRIYGPTYDSPLNPVYINRQSNDEGFFDLSGGSRVDQYVANFNIMLTPWKHVAIVPSFRFEHQEQEGFALFTETRVTNTASPFATEDILNSRVRRFTDVTEALDVRYTGITNWSLYARAEFLQGEGRLRETEFDREDENSPLVVLQRDTKSDRRIQKYVAGANWYPTRKANFAGQYYYRSRNNDYDHVLDTTIYDPPPPPTSTNNLYPAFIREHDFDTHDVNFRVTYRPFANLTLVSRYDFQVTTYGTRGDVNAFGIALQDIQSAEAKSHILSQSASWSPLPQFYVQGSISYAFQRTETPASSLTGGAANLVQDARNDYWNAGVLAGYSLCRWSDVQANYYFYKADNYRDNSSVSLPFGASAEQHGVTATLINRLRKNIVWKIQYGFFTGKDDTSGGNNDYSAHLVYSSWQYLF